MPRAPLFALGLLIAAPIPAVLAQQRDTSRTLPDSARGFTRVPSLRNALAARFRLLPWRADSARPDSLRWNPSTVQWEPVAVQFGGVLAGVRAGATCARFDLVCSSELEGAYRRGLGRRTGLGYAVGGMLGGLLSTERSRQLRLLADTTLGRRP